MSNLIKKVRIFLNNGKFGYLAKNSVLLTISQFGSKLLSFVLTPLYTSILITSEMGMADIVITTSMLLYFPVTLCIGDAVFVYAMDKASDKIGIFKYGMIVIIKGLAVFSILLTAFSVINPIGWPFYSYIFLWIHLVLSSITAIVTCYLRAIDRIKEVAIAGFITTAVTVFCNVLLLLFIKLGLIGYLASISIGLFLALIYMICKCDDFVKMIHTIVCDRQIQCEMVKYSLPLIINGVSWWINGSLDRFFVSLLAGMDSNGIYAVSSKIPTILSTINVIFAQAWSVSAIKEYDKNDSDGFFSIAYTGYNFGMLMFSSILILINVFLAKLLFAGDYFVAWKSSVWLIISVLFSAMSGFVGSVFGAVKNSKVYAVSTLVAAAVNIILNMVLIPEYKEIGAAIATAISFFVMWLVRFLYSRKFIQWRIRILRDVIAYALLVAQAWLCLQNDHKYWLQIICLSLIIVLYLNEFKSTVGKIMNKMKETSNIYE